MAGKKTARKKASARKSNGGGNGGAARKSTAANAATLTDESEGVNLMENPPEGHIAVGDGTPENPNRIERVRNWHGATHTG